MRGRCGKWATGWRLFWRSKADVQPVGRPGLDAVEALGHGKHPVRRKTVIDHDGSCRKRALQGQRSGRRWVILCAGCPGGDTYLQQGICLGLLGGGDHGIVSGLVQRCDAGAERNPRAAGYLCHGTGRIRLDGHRRRVGTRMRGHDKRRRGNHGVGWGGQRHLGRWRRFNRRACWACRACGMMDRVAGWRLDLWCRWRLGRRFGRF
jgi:hypothetical protein